MTKKKVQIAVALILVVAVSVGALLYVRKVNDKRYDAVLMEVSSGSITQTISTSGTVKSGNRGVFTPLDGTIVKTVNVKVGDKVKKGDVLATFDTSSLSEVVNDKQKAYDNAKVTYYNSLNSSSNASSQLPGVEAEIKVLESKIASLNKVVEQQKTAEETTAAVENENEETYDTSSLKDRLGDAYNESRLSELFGKLNKSGVSKSGISQLIDNLSSLGSIGSFDLGTIMGKSEEETELLSLQVELLSLKAQQTVLKTQATNVLEATYKSLMNSAEKTLQITKLSVAELKKGWVATADGIVSAVNIVPGQKYIQPSVLDGLSEIDLSSVLSSLTNGSIDLNSILASLAGGSNNAGITIEYYDSFVATFSLGKYDVLDVKVGQQAKITSLGQEYEGEIIYISPVASSSGSLDIGSLLGGITGSSSSTAIEARVIIKNPDDHVIVGMDVDIDIDIDTVEDTVVIPIEAVQSDATGHYIYLYDENEKTVKKVEAQIGLTSDTGYQIISGCKVGDIIVRNQSSTLEDGAKVNAEMMTETTAV